MYWKLAALQVKSMKHYFIASALVFVVGIILGAGYSDQYQAFLESQVKALQELAKTVPSGNNQQLHLFWLIFWNNASKSFLMIALGGVLFGVIPLFFLLANGMILGFIGLMTVQKSSLLYVLKSIVPHGIIEIPAIIVACAFGIKFGFLLMKTLFKMISPVRSAGVFEELKIFFRSLLPVAISLVLLLLVAALIESTITFWLAKV